MSGLTNIGSYWRDGMKYQQKYSHGKPVTTLSCHVLQIESQDQQGRHIKFWPDREGFSFILLVVMNLMVI